MPINSLTTTQKKATKLDDLIKSYNKLYNEWLGQYRNIELYTSVLSQLCIEASSNLLDISCGLGDLLSLASKANIDAYGIDISIVALKKGQTLHNGSLRVALADAEQLPFSSNSFSYVTCIGSLEHFINPAQGVREIARVLKPNGRAAINVPNSHHIQAIYNVFKTGSILPELQDYERFATRHEWQNFLQENGLTVQKVHKYNTGFSRIFFRKRELFWLAYNTLYKLIKDKWIPLNLSFAFTFICTKKDE